VAEQAPAGIYQRAILDHRFVCIMRRDHPLAERPMDLDAFLSQRHVLISSPGRNRAAVDAGLERLGHPPRNIALRLLPHFMASTAAVAATDLITTLPRRIAEYMARHEALVVREPPMALQGFSLQLLWHERCHDDRPAAGCGIARRAPSGARFPRKPRHAMPRETTTCLPGCRSGGLGARAIAHPRLRPHAWKIHSLPRGVR
jgi:DNA-binding transcriptional LysR family regulator